MTLEEFVGTRLADLVRLAVVLCGNRALGEALVAVAAGQAYAGRIDVTNPDDTYSQLRAWTVRGYLSEGMQLGNGPATDVDAPIVDAADANPDWDDLTKRFVTSSKLQRAVAALRYGEELSNAEIAATVGSTVEGIELYLRRVLWQLNIRSADGAGPSGPDTNTEDDVRALLMLYGDDVDPDVSALADQLRAAVSSPEPEPAALAPVAAVVTGRNLLDLDEHHEVPGAQDRAAPPPRYASDPLDLDQEPVLIDDVAPDAEPEPEPAPEPELDVESADDQDDDPNEQQPGRVEYRTVTFSRLLGDDEPGPPPESAKKPAKTKPLKSKPGNTKPAKTKPVRPVRGKPALAEKTTRPPNTTQPPRGGGGRTPASQFKPSAAAVAFDVEDPDVTAEPVAPQTGVRHERDRRRLAIVAAIVIVLIVIIVGSVEYAGNGAGGSGAKRREMKSPLRDPLPGTTVVGDYRGAGSRTLHPGPHQVPSEHDLALNVICAGSGPVTVGPVRIGTCGAAVSRTVTGVKLDPLAVHAPAATRWRIIVNDQPQLETNGVIENPPDVALANPAAGNILAFRSGSGTQTLTIAPPAEGTAPYAVRLAVSCTGSGVSIGSNVGALDGKYTHTCFEGWSYDFDVSATPLPATLTLTAASTTSWRIAAMSN